MEVSEQDLTPEGCSMSCDVLCEVLEVAFHQILYTRELYPQTAFQRKRKYNHPVQICMHPGVASYVLGVVAGVRPLLQTGQLRALQLVVLDDHATIREKFVFEITQMMARAHTIREDPELLHLEESMRSLFLKLSISDSLLAALPPRCTFRVLLQVPSSAAPLLHNTRVDETEDAKCVWVEADAKESMINSPHLVPLKNIESEVCNLELYVHEAQQQAGDRQSD